MSPTRILLLSALAVSLAASPKRAARAQENPAVDEGGPLGPKMTPAALHGLPESTIGPPHDAKITTPAPIESTPPANATPAEREKWLVNRIDDILNRPGLIGVHSGVMVAEIDTGRTLYARNEHTLYNPASNAKLFTTAAALGLLGPEYRFKTALYASSVKAGEVQGDLYLKGNGDPTLATEDLWRLVSDLAGAGVRHVNGSLAIDDTYFDDVRVGPAFEQKNEDYAFRAPEGAVSFNYNACTVRIVAGSKDGATPKVIVEPASPYFTVINTAKTVGKGTKGKAELTVTSKEGEGHTEITVAGTIRTGGSDVTEHRRIAHPDLYTGFALRELLTKRGIKLGGEKVVRAAVPPGARQLSSHYSPPLGVIVREVNKTSNNFMAEQLLKTLGAEVVGKPGTWPKGVQAVAKYLDGIGIAEAGYKMVNGSGLYDADRFTPAQFVELLRHTYRDFRFAADFVGSLAVAGTDGTIGHRMEGSTAERWVRAKTGTLSGVSCLSGYAGAPSHLPLAFSILMNTVGETATGEARKAQDAIAESLVTFLGAGK